MDVPLLPFFQEIRVIVIILFLPSFGWFMFFKYKIGLGCSQGYCNLVGIAYAYMPVYFVLIYHFAFAKNKIEVKFHIFGVIVVCVNFED